MGRECCQFCSVWNDEVYCDYYDFLVAKCQDIEHCPDGLDDDEPEYYEGDEYDYDDESEQIIF